MKRVWKIGKTGMRIIGLVVNVPVVTALVFSAYGGMIDPEVTAVGAIAAMLFPIFAILDVALTVVNLVMWRRMALINVLAMLCCLGPIYTFCPVNLPHGEVTDKNRDRTFTLLTYNTYAFMYEGGERYDGFTPNRTLSYIIAKDPDVVVLQESFPLRGLSSWRLCPEQMDTLRQRYPYKIVNPFGLGLLSKYPADSIKVYKESFEQSVSADFTAYRVMIKGKLVHIYNVHLQSIGLTGADKELYETLTSGALNRGKIDEARRELMGKLGDAFRNRAIQARDLRHNVDSIGGNAIICGDFNDIPGCYATRLARGHDFIDAYAFAGCGPAITYYANRFYFRIDHIFYRGYLRCLSVERDRVRSSDHYPLFATFEWDNLQR